MNYNEITSPRPNPREVEEIAPEYVKVAFYIQW